MIAMKAVNSVRTYKYAKQAAHTHTHTYIKKKKNTHAHESSSVRALLKQIDSIIQREKHNIRSSCNSCLSSLASTLTCLHNSKTIELCSFFFLLLLLILLLLLFLGFLEAAVNASFSHAFCLPERVAVEKKKSPPLFKYILQQTAVTQP